MPQFVSTSCSGQAGKATAIAACHTHTLLAVVKGGSSVEVFQELVR